MLCFKRVSVFYRIFLLAAVLLLAAAPVHAGSGDGPYLSLSGAINFSEDMDLSTQSTGLSAVLRAIDASIETDAGLGFAHAIGYRFGNTFSAEVEFAFQELDFNKGTSSTGEITVEGDIDTKTLMANAIYHFDSRGSNPTTRWFNTIWAPYSPRKTITKKLLNTG
ncbi:hypothetical protein UZ36_05050 [Candidatus Nitromaritima sp. SCGC AAA799-C22]|nr:hypothetical protein UZ36_05050 [Candidatus Nitromaritima sp. SCGC AAA799-C22]